MESCVFHLKVCYVSVEHAEDMEVPLTANLHNTIMRLSVLNPRACMWPLLADWFYMSRNGGTGGGGEVGWYTHRVKTAWLCLDLSVS